MGARKDTGGMRRIAGNQVTGGGQASLWTFHCSRVPKGKERERMYQAERIRIDSS